MKKVVKKIGIMLLIAIMVFPFQLLNDVSVQSSEVHERELGNGLTLSANGCRRKVRKKSTVLWELQRQPIDLVVLQDASGSFTNTIGKVQQALYQLTTPVTAESYNPEQPRLIFTNNPATSDRVMLATYRGMDYIRYFNADENSDFATTSYYDSGGVAYTYTTTELLNQREQIHQAISQITVGGGTPTVPAIEDTLAEYRRLTNGEAGTKRKTVFLLITDGVANAYRPAGQSTVMADVSLKRRDNFNNYYQINDSAYYNLEAGQDYLTRSREVIEAGNRIKQAIGDHGTVVVGFWEDVYNFESLSQYANGYRGGFSFLDYNNQGDNRSVQQVFHSAIQSVASPNKKIAGEDTSFYVNEQSDPQRFTEKILKAVTAAFVKEKIVGNFQVTDGYKVDSIRINQKKVVEKVQDASQEIQGTVKQNGNQVTVEVAETVFAQGENSFEYELSKEAETRESDEEEEPLPPADYKDETVEMTVPELKGSFRIGEYQTQQVGGSQDEKVKVEELGYCYPVVTKQIADQNKQNDTGLIDDPLNLSKRQSYAAVLNRKDENFTYTVNYHFNNSSYEFEKNVMMVDPIDSRFEIVSAKALAPDGTEWPVRIIEQDQRKVVVADVPAENGNYQYLRLKQAQLQITARFKDLADDGQELRSIIAENSGHGIVNQAYLAWNGDDKEQPNEASHAATDTTKKTLRKSNAVYVKPPLNTPPNPTPRDGVVGEFTLKKHDESGNPLAGAEFSLENESGTVVQQHTSTNQKEGVSFKNIAPGEYRLREVKAPQGYELSKDYYKIMVDRYGIAHVTYMSADDNAGTSRAVRRAAVVATPRATRAAKTENLVEVTSYSLTATGNRPAVNRTEAVWATSGDFMKMTYSLRIKDDARPGDSFTIQLDSKISPTGVRERILPPIPLKVGDEIVATGRYVEEKNQFIYTFTDYIASHKNVQLTASYTTFAGDLQKVPNTGTYTFVNTIDGQVQAAKQFYIDYGVSRTMPSGVNRGLQIRNQVALVDRVNGVVERVIYLNNGRGDRDYVSAVGANHKLTLQNHSSDSEIFDVEVYRVPRHLKEQYMPDSMPGVTDGLEKIEKSFNGREILIQKDDFMDSATGYRSAGLLIKVRERLTNRGGATNVLATWGYQAAGASVGAAASVVESGARSAGEAERWNPVVSMINRKAVAKEYNLKILKRDAINQKIGLEATFGLYDEKGEKQLFQGVTNTEEHSLEWKGLKPGKYILKEVTAPDNYHGLSDLHVTLDENGKLTITGEDAKRVVSVKQGESTQLEVVITNMRKGIFPKTGGMGSGVIIGLGVVIILMANKMNKKEENIK